MTSAPAREVTGPELRRRIREGGAQHAEAQTEFERRRAALQGGLVPAWELSLRGPDPSKWAPE